MKGNAEMEQSDFRDDRWGYVLLRNHRTRASGAPSTTLPTLQTTLQSSQADGPVMQAQKHQKPSLDDLYNGEQELHVPAGGIIYAKLTHHVAVQFSITSKSVKELFEPKAVLQLSSSKLEGQRFCPEKSDKRQEGRPIYNFQGERCKGLSSVVCCRHSEDLAVYCVPASVLSMAAPSRLAAAAEHISKADALLICTGAGMGVDSGLGTFRGRNAGVWPPLKAMQMDFSEMSSPDWFDTDPRLAWAFWRFRHQAYTLGEPHRGYSLLAEWGNKMKYGLFSVTSNIDGHWDRTEGVGPAKVWERHGALTRMQCVEDDESIWPTDAKDLTSIEVPEWDLQAGDEVLALVAGAEVPAVVQEDGCSLAVDGEPVSAKAVRRKDGPDLLRSLPGSRLPRSREGKPARPNVLMFSDFGVNMRIISEQEQRFNAWLKELPESANLVIVEVGAGKAVPTIRFTSERIMGRFQGASLIRINWDDSDVGRHLQERSISIGGIGALEALTKINELLES
ncbi:NAD-dependent protein deacylase (Regulatory protein SIR2 homolog) [Durusdinium trenchii]|uniref:NAD-dependent protein deacylase (Regulatory protein SIR2 homolog) n=1 Tax=Durusdinium trenchii TaxID=1381693 RepID=A0ABP0I549_9DINO